MIDLAVPIKTSKKGSFTEAFAKPGKRLFAVGEIEVVKPLKKGIKSKTGF